MPFWRRRPRDGESAARALLEDLAEEAERAYERTLLMEVTSLPAWERATAATRRDEALLVLAGTEMLAEGAFRRRSAIHHVGRSAVRKLVETLLRRKLPLGTAGVERLVRATGACETLAAPSPLLVLRQVEWNLEAIPPELGESLRALEAVAGADTRKVRARVDELLGGAPPWLPDAGDLWADVAREELGALDADARGAWEGLLANAQQSTAARPSKRFLASAREHLSAVGDAVFLAALRRWCAHVRPPAKGEHVDDWSGHHRRGDQNVRRLRGLLWTLGLVDDPAAPALLGEVARHAFARLPNGDRAFDRVGPAALGALEVSPRPEAVAELLHLKRVLRDGNARRAAERSLAAVAEREGLSEDELVEIGAPTLGFDVDGVRREALGEATAELRVAGTTSVALTFAGSDGRPRKSVPAAVRRDHKAELAALRGTRKAAEELLAAHRGRLDRLLRSRRGWSLGQWRERFLLKPLVAPLVGRLIWRVSTGGDDYVGLGAAAVPDGAPDDARVTLWHPVDVATDAVVAWRERIVHEGVTQPFKQAHREVYRLTDAERATGTYSNRFAAHVLKQHQFSALARQRGWRYRLRGQWWGDEAPASLDLPEWGLQAQFWVEGIWDDAAQSDAGVHLYASTDQVRFVPLGQAAAAEEPVPLEQVPPVVLSEVLRDVDLFVGVASVGNDPSWRDSGGQVAQQHGTYWDAYSFGELSATAETRRDVLAALIPRLKIADRCRIEGRFLRVQGDLRAYRIHLGSGNILMEPDDEYLCIVPDRPAARSGPAGGLVLPFEGDGTLSLILSKAFLLAADRAIDDPTILRQIRR